MKNNLITEFITVLRLQGRHRDTLDQYQHALHCYIEYLVQKNIFSLTAAKEEDITQYYLLLHDQGYAASTRWNKTFPVYCLYEWLKERGTILYNPAPKPRIKAQSLYTTPIPANKALRDAFSLLSCSQTLVDQRDYRLIDLAYSCGLRRCEMQRLNVEDICSEENTIRVKGKRNTQRLIPLGENTCTDLLSYVYYIRPQFLKKSTTHALFVSKLYGGQRMSRGSINAAFSRIRKKYNLDSTIKPHALRHAFATHLLQHGAAVQDVSKMLGHKKLETTQIYTKVMPCDLKKHHAQYHPRS